jgi:hypothetical protein
MGANHRALAAGPIYLDYNATVDPRVAEAALPYLTHHFGNPSSGHRRSRAAEVANLIGAVPDRIVFTGSGSEADALAIQGGVLATAGHIYKFGTLRLGAGKQAIIHTGKGTSYTTSASTHRYLGSGLVCVEQHGRQGDPATRGWLT